MPYPSLPLLGADRSNVADARLAERSRVDMGVKRYGAAFLRAYNRQRPFTSCPYVAFDAAWLECGRQPHEEERRNRAVARYAHEHALPAPTIRSSNTPSLGSARRRGAGRPRSQAARSSANSGNSGDSDPGEPSPTWASTRADPLYVPVYVRHFAREAQLRVDQLRWCCCGVVAFAIDDYQRRELDRAGFTVRMCPACAGIVR